MREVSIVGRGSGYNKVNEAGGTVWAVSSVFEKLSPDKVDLIFQLHKPDVFEDWLPSQHDKVMTAFNMLGFYQLYPVDDILKKYGAVFGSTVAWMLALAIERGYEKINLFGLDMATRQEYVDQRDTVFYLIGRAEERGIQICIPEDSRLYFKDRIYGVL